MTHFPLSLPVVFFFLPLLSPFLLRSSHLLKSIMSYFTSLLNTNVYDVDDTEPSEIPEFSTQNYSQKKKGRATNFSIDEDMLLISAWQNVSMDLIQGSNQTHQTYWNRISNYYDENKSFSSVRAPNSLCHRWSVINTSVSKFIGYYNQIQGRNQSGLCEQDKERQTLKMYATLQKKAFHMVHCWTVLRNSPKFGATIQKKTQKSPNDSPKSSASAQSPFTNKPSQESEERMERPMRRKAAKRLKRIEHDAKGDEFLAVITQAKDTMARLSEARNETIQQLIDLEKERLKAAKEQERARESKGGTRESNVRNIHLGHSSSTMEEPLAQYYKSLKDDILKKRI